MINEETCYEIFIPLQRYSNTKLENDYFFEVPLEEKTDIELSHGIEMSNNCENNKIQPLKVTNNAILDKESVFADNFGSFFYKFAGPDEAIDSFKLQNLLSIIFKQKGIQFNLETSRCILASADSNRDGKLSYYEFKRLWFNLMKWKKCFKEFDLNKDKMINKSELKLCFESLGFIVENGTIDLIVARYADKQDQIRLDDFIQILCKLTSVNRWIKHFNRKGNLDAFMKEVLYF
ncbi:calpain small subunit 1 [Hydra vulgaris]|uniref:calpain small subunit 1 n=1 Tax=Hydra vulgaris TaxID=6087 RepID=UPI001F5EECAD|nr:calpain small subunit 1-like [Hydra vulgaris]